MLQTYFLNIGAKVFSVTAKSFSGLTIKYVEFVLITRSYKLSRLVWFKRVRMKGMHGIRDTDYNCKWAIKERKVLIIKTGTLYQIINKRGIVPSASCKGDFPMVNVVLSCPVWESRDRAANRKPSDLNTLGRHRKVASPLKGKEKERKRIQ